MDIKFRPVGLHVRLKNGLIDVAQDVQQYDMPVVQSFFIDEAGAYVNLNARIIDEFKSIKKKLGFLYFVHATYWSNVSNFGSKEFISLCKEAEIARALGSEGIVVHVGATRARLAKREQAFYVAECVNELLHRVSDITLVLENGPHAGRNFGGDLTDFGLLLEHVEQKDRVKFCLDTAHAFVFGYDLTNPVKCDDFFKLIVDVIGKQNIALLHLNDAPEKCGSYIDKHGIPGEGLLGVTLLKSVMQHDLCKDVPVILELPGTCQEEQALQVLRMVQHWDLEKN